MSADEDGALLLFRFGSRGRLGGKLQDGGFLAFAELGQEHGLSIRELKRVMMDVRRLLVDLPEDRRGVGQGLDAAAEETRRFNRDLFRERDFCPRHQADSSGTFLRRREAAGPGAEVSCDKFVADLGWARCNAV